LTKYLESIRWLYIKIGVQILNISEGSKSSSPPSYAPLTVKKALSILYVLAEEKEALGLAELAKKLGLNRSTAYRLVLALTEGGFVKQDPATQKYALGLKIVELAGDILNKMEIREVARPYLKRLMELSGETAHLGILEKGQIVFIDKIDGPEVVRFFTHLGKRFPAYVTSIGKAILAYLPKEDLENVLKLQSFQAHTPNTIVNKQDFRDHLNLVRSKGYAIDHEENRLTVCCIGAPIFDATGKAVAAISISGPSFRLNIKRMKELSEPLKSTALKISKNLGYQEEEISFKNKKGGKES